jgi:antibiotic biosynthesis monooxygenase (ABM) superfamily enzyme
VSWRDKALLSALVWICVYPAVLLMTYVFEWLRIDLPRWLELMVSTAVSVPLISICAVPWVERVVAAVRHQTPAELKLDQARQVPGPNPEEIVDR